MSVQADLFAGLEGPVTLTDTTLRDGLQSLPETYPLAVKLKIVDLLVSAGLHSIEATSFMRPDRVPQLADGEALMDEIRARYGDIIELRGLVANRRGLTRAVASGVDVAVVLMTLSDAYALRNQGMDSERNLELAVDLVHAASDQGVAVDVAYSMPIFCPYEGAIAPSRVQAVTARLTAAGAHNFTLCTSTGLENPREVCAALALMRAEGAAEVALHLHDTNGMGLAVAMAGLLSGVRRFETALGGVGGGIALPSGMPGHGNLPTEDMAHLLAEIGLRGDVAPISSAATTVSHLLGRQALGRAAQGATKAAILANTKQEIA
jgi:hydroxymethylglutaryl-CoA lyase